MKKLIIIFCICLISNGVFSKPQSNILNKKEEPKTNFTRNVKGNKIIDLRETDNPEVQEAIHANKPLAFSFITYYGERILDCDTPIDLLKEGENPTYTIEEETKEQDSNTINLKKGDHINISMKRVQIDPTKETIGEGYTFHIFLKSTNDNKEYDINIKSFQTVIRYSDEIAQPNCNCN